MEKQADIYNSPIYKRSRHGYTAHCAFEHFVSLMLSSTMLALLFSNIGMSDAMVGIISSISSLIVVVQIVSVFLLHRLRKPKLFVTLGHALCRAFFGLMYLVPLFPVPNSVKQIIVIACFIVGYAGYYLMFSYVFAWGNSYVDPDHRGVYSAKKVKISLMSGFAVTLITGYVIDRFTELDNLVGGFLFISISILVFVTCDLICLMRINQLEQPHSSEGKTISMREIMDNTLNKKEYRRLLIFNLIYCVAAGAINGFVGTYQIKELGFSVGILQAMTVGAGIIRFFAERPIGLYADKRSYVSGAKLGLVFYALSLAVILITFPKTRYLMILYILLLEIANAGIGQNMINAQYECVDQKYFSEAYAIRSCITGLCGFGSSIIAGILLDRIQKNGNMLFGIRIYAQHALAILSLCLVIVAIAYAQLVIRKNNKKVREKKGNV